MSKTKTVESDPTLRKMFPNEKGYSYGWVRTYYGQPHLTFLADFSAIKVRVTIFGAEINEAFDVQNAQQSVGYVWEALTAEQTQAVKEHLQEKAAARRAKAQARRKAQEAQQRKLEAERARPSVAQALEILRQAGWEVSFKGNS